MMRLQTNAFVSWQSTNSDVIDVSLSLGATLKPEPHLAENASIHAWSSIRPKI